MERLEDAPPWVVEAGVDYANDEFEGHDLIQHIEKQDGNISIEYIDTDDELDNTLENNLGKRESKMTLDILTVEKPPEKFKKELERRND